MSTQAKRRDGDGAGFRIPAAGNAWSNLWKVTAVLAVIGIGLSAWGYSADPRRFAFSWLFAFITFLTVGLGAIFFVFIQHLTVAHWSVSVRRIAEFFAAGIPVFAILFLPIIGGMDHLYEWAGHGHEAPAVADASGEALLGASTAQAQEVQAGPGEPTEAAGGHRDTPQHALHAELLEHKGHWLAEGYWLARAVIYFLIWSLLALFYFRTSIRQDKSKDVLLTGKMQKWAPLAGVAWALTMTFAVFDWVMALEPTWYSTIYGVYIFAGCAVTIHALLTVVGLSLRAKGLTGEAVHLEHFHDLGKMTFGFIVFWAYIGFSQMMLIWYANIPEETVYYQYRWHAEGWRGVSWLLVIGHFAFPFVFLISRNVKRRLGLLAFGCSWMLVMHVVDIYWFVMPNFERGRLVLDVMDVGALLAVGGVYLTVVFQLMTRHALIPVGDPRLGRCLQHSN